MESIDLRLPRVPPLPPRIRGHWGTEGALRGPGGTQTLSGSADEWAQFCHTADNAAATSQKSKMSGKKGDGSKTGQSSQGESKPAASSVAKSSTGKGSKLTGKEAGLPDSQHWLHSYKVLKLPTPGTSVSSKGKALHKADKRK